jgi:retron-type reverse transcriptase
VLKCDIRKFFASIDHAVLKGILKNCIADADILWLLSQVIDSFNTPCNTPTHSSMLGCSKGLPLGNLTSQLLVNVYMNEFDQFAKHKLKAAYYIRYADDFVVLSHGKGELTQNLRYIEGFLLKHLKLELHTKKVFIQTFASGVDLLGWVHFPDHRVLRTSTKRRMLRRLTGAAPEETRSSYLGLLKHGNTHKLSECV